MSRKHIYLILSILFISIILQLSSGGKTLEETFSVSYGWMDFGEISSMIVSLTCWLLPQVVLCVFWGNYLEEEILNNLPYILTRTKIPQKLFRKAYVKLAGFVTISTIGFLVVPILTNMQKSSIALENIGFQKIILWICYQLISIFLVNALSMFFTATYGIGILFFLEIVMWFFYKMAVIQFIPQWFVRMIPISAVRFFDGNILQNHFYCEGLILFALFTVVVMMIGIRFVAKRDNL